MVYTATAISVVGYNYINAEKIYKKNDWGYIERYGRKVVLDIDYTNFKYSLLTSIVLGILIYSVLILFKNKQN